jgi:hypothetical protein
MYLVSLNRAMVWYLKSSGFASTFKIRTLRRSATKSIDEQTDLGYLSSLQQGGGQVDQAVVYLLGRPMDSWQSHQWRGSRQGVMMSAERTAFRYALPLLPTSCHLTQTVQYSSSRVGGSL